MINFRCASRTENDDISAIINEKYSGLIKDTLNATKPKIIGRYSQYINIESNTRVDPIAFTLDERSALLSLYGSKTKTARKITDGVLETLNPNHSDTCLYCGIGEIDEIDHFLPQEHFPEFSILHKNLIPTCGRCNEIKGASIPGKDGKDFLHMIYDIVPLENIFLCRIDYGNSKPIVQFELITRFETSIIGKHYHSLKLKKRIEKKAIQYCLQIRALKEQFGNAYALEEMERDAKKTQLFFTPFYWKSELINEMMRTNFVENVQ